MDYSKDRYNVFDGNNKLIGRIDEDEFIRKVRGPGFLYRLEEDEVYDVSSGKIVGYIEDGVLRASGGKVIFKIEEE
jgi:hypothetical protein